MPLASRIMVPAAAIRSRAFRTDCRWPYCAMSCAKKIVPLPRFFTLLSILSSMLCIDSQLMICRKNTHFFRHITILRHFFVLTSLILPFCPNETSGQKKKRVIQIGIVWCNVIDIPYWMYKYKQSPIRVVIGCKNCVLTGSDEAAIILFFWPERWF